MSDVFDLTRGESPLIVSFPHSGEDISPYANRMTAAAHKVPDCDWHLPRLYSFLSGTDVTCIKANYARYVIDLNRDSSGKSLYPGQNVTELCPTTTFEEEAVYQNGQAPDEVEVQERVATYWRPYHDALKIEIDRVKAIHGYALLWDAHSIRSHVPRFFEGRLPDLNFGTNNDETCNPTLSETIMDIVSDQQEYSSVLNGRFKGGFITRNYGDPANSVHAVQLELSQVTYMNEDYPYGYEATHAEDIASLIKRIIERVKMWRPETVVS
ncbi:MAG: N-formylglutamate deformylase [Kordiimonas sp.]